MAILTIPTNPQGAYYFEQLTQLNGVEYLFRFEWNDRLAGWFVSLATADGTDIVQSRRLVVNHELLKGLVGENAPPGVMVLLVPDSGTDDPTFESLGVRHFLVYVEGVPPP